MPYVLTDLDLQNTVDSGQIFSYYYNKGYDIVTDKVFNVNKKSNKLFFKGIKRKEIIQFFNLNKDLDKIKKSVSKDIHIRKAINTYPNLRIINQDPFHCLTGFICSSMTNIPRIKKMLGEVRKRFGEKFEFEGKEYYVFPSKINSMAKLKKCNLGYRDKYLFKLHEKFDASIVDLDYESAKQELVKIDGVGDKIADCVLLFSLGKEEAFPIDTWIAKGMRRIYGDKINKTKMGNYSYKEIQHFARSWFGDKAGWAQQWFYHYWRNGKKLDDDSTNVVV